MSDLPSDLDLKFLPDWLKESTSGNRYADYEGDREDRSGRDDRARGEHSSRGERGERRDRKAPRREKARAGERPTSRSPKGARADKKDNRPPSGGPARPPLAASPPTVKIEFFPEPTGLAMIAKQIKASGRAYPLFGTARLFLEKPERHRVRFTSLDPARPLFQVGDGPVLFDRAIVERNAFSQMKGEFYREERVEGDPLKGNFSNVARSRTTGMLLGPTNHHGYQPALRKLYEERFSRRMSFAQFQHEEIQILTDGQAIADWKEQARAVTTYTTLRDAEPAVFKSAADAEQHFRKQYLPGLVKSAVTLETSGDASRASGDRQIGNTLREMWEKERAFPVHLVNNLRSGLVEAGLHFFKHRKRILYISPIRPQRHVSGQIFSEGIATILSLVESNPRITRPQLAAKILGDHHERPEAAAKKAALAADLHYLIHAGHVIEFHDGTLELPLSAKAENETVPVKQNPRALAGGAHASHVPAESRPPSRTVSPAIADDSGQSARDVLTAAAEQPVLEEAASLASESGDVADRPMLTEGSQRIPAERAPLTVEAAVSLPSDPPIATEHARDEPPAPILQSLVATEVVEAPLGEGMSSEP